MKWSKAKAEPSSSNSSKDFLKALFIRKNGFLVPVQKGGGATYKWKSNNNSFQSESFSEMIDFLKKITNDLEILEERTRAFESALQEGGNSVKANIYFSFKNERGVRCTDSFQRIGGKPGKYTKESIAFWDNYWANQ